MLFQENGKSITIDDGVQRLSCPVDQFVQYEPDYVPLSAPFIARYWSDDLQYCTDGQTQQADAFYTPARLSTYITNLAAYQQIAAMKPWTMPTPEALLDPLYLSQRLPEENLR